MVEQELKTTIDAETAKKEEKNNKNFSHTTKAISNTTKTATPPELREIAREGRESHEERLWFPEDEDFRGPFCD